MRNSAIKKYIPLFDRMEEIYHVASGFGQRSGWQTKPKYKRGFFYDSFYGWARPTSKPKLAYTIQRIRNRRNGQLELFPILKEQT